jgi:sugar phosphate isomerase/epimerase
MKAMRRSVVLQSFVSSFGLAPASPIRYRRAVRAVSVSQITTLNWPFERDVEAIAAAGAPGIGIAIRKLEAIGLERAVALVRGAGLAVSCLTSSGLFPLGDEAGEREALARTRRHLEAAAALGADALMVLPGANPALSWEEAAARATPLFAALLPDAERLGVRLAIEPTSQLAWTSRSCTRSTRRSTSPTRIDSPWLTVDLELNNAWIERRLYENIRRRCRRIGVVQISDFRVGTLAASERVVIGDGDIPLRRLCAALADAGYDGWYDIELLGRRSKRGLRRGGAARRCAFLGSCGQ